MIAKSTLPPGGRVQLERKLLADLAAAPWNPRKISEKALAGLGESVKRFGLVVPIVWNRATGHVVGGHQRIKALLAQNVVDTDVVVVELPEIEEKALNVALNSGEISGEWTPDAMALIDEIAASMPDLAQALLMSDLRGAIEDLVPREKRGVTEDDAPPPPENPVSKLGDLWFLGPHRILCGDSTKPEALARLMGSEKAVLLATDPPYLVDYKGGNHPQSWSNRPEVRDKHWDDYQDPESGVAFFEAFLRAGLAHCAEDVAIYQWHAHRRQDLVDEAWKRLLLLRHQQIIWAKTHAVLTRSHFMWAHEPCVYGWVEGKPPSRRPPPNETTIWSIDQKGQSDGIHPTQKPVELFARPIRFHTVPDDVCLEPFSGSGTQIVAAQQLDRRCFAMEIAPAYVDVAVTRWENLTGKKAERQEA